MVAATPRRALAVALLAVATACGAPTQDARASGALVIELDDEGVSRDAIDARIATEVEVLRSRPLAARVVQRLALDRDPSAVDGVLSAVRVARRGESLVIEVGIAGDDPAHAAMVCNALLESYLEARMEARLSETMRNAEWLASQLDALAAEPGTEARRAEIEERLRDLDRERATARSDARVLEPCDVRR